MSKKKTKNSEAAVEEPALEQEPAAQAEAPETPEAPEPAAEPDAEAPKAELSSEEQQLKDRLLRLQADFDNFRKRTAREKSEWQAYATEQLILDLLPVVDHYEMGLATAEKQGVDDAVMQGLRLVYDQLLGVFKKQGVTPISVEPGTPFNPHEHEAISHVPSEEHAADVVIAETRKGYRQGEKLIRPLQVVVSSGPGEPAVEEKPE